MIVLSYFRYTTIGVKLKNTVYHIAYWINHSVPYNILPASFNKFTMLYLISFVIFTILCHSHETYAHKNGQREFILLIILKFTLDSLFRVNEKKWLFFYFLFFTTYYYYILDILDILDTFYIMSYVFCVLLFLTIHYMLCAIRYFSSRDTRNAIQNTNFSFCILELYYHHRISKTVKPISFFNCFFIRPKKKILSNKSRCKH